MAFRDKSQTLACYFSRRRFLIGSMGIGAALAHESHLFAAAEFWIAKDPSAWTDEEIQTLITKSPWARLAAQDVKHSDEPVQSAGDGGGGRGAGTVNRRGSSVNSIVRWESAQPVLDAFHGTLPAEYAGHYVLSVSNLPRSAVRLAGRGADAAPDEALDRMQAGATLQAKGKGPAEAGIVRRSRVGSVLFGFLKDNLQLTANDRDIVFALDTGEVTLKAKFDGKEMLYHGKLGV